MDNIINQMIEVTTQFEDLEVQFLKVTSCLKENGLMLIYGFQPFMNMFVLSEASVFDENSFK